MFQTISERSAFRQPQRQARSHARRETKQFELLAELAVVALLGLLEHRQVFVEHRFFRKGDSVDTGQHLVVLVAAPVGPGHRSQLDRLHVPHVRQVRPAAQIGKITVRIETDRPVFEPLDQFHFILVAFFGIGLHRLGLADLAATDRLLRARQFFHLFLDLRQIAFGDRRRTVHIVVKAVLDARPNPELDPRIERFERLGQQMRRRVPERFLAFGIFPFVQFDRRIFVDRAVQIDDLAVDRSRQHLLRQARADALRNLHCGRSLGVLTNAAVGKSYFYHHESIRLSGAIRAAPAGIRYAFSGSSGSSDADTSAPLSRLYFCNGFAVIAAYRRRLRTTSSAR